MDMIQTPAYFKAGEYMYTVSLFIKIHIIHVPSCIVCLWMYYSLSKLCSIHRCESYFLWKSFAPTMSHNLLCMCVCMSEFWVHQSVCRQPHNRYWFTCKYIHNFNGCWQVSPPQGFYHLSRLLTICEATCFPNSLVSSICHWTWTFLPLVINEKWHFCVALIAWFCTCKSEAYCFQWTFFLYPLPRVNGLPFKKNKLSFYVCQWELIHHVR